MTAARRYATAGKRGTRLLTGSLGVGYQSRSASYFATAFQCVPCQWQWNFLGLSLLVNVGGASETRRRRRGRSEVFRDLRWPTSNAVRQKQTHRLEAPFTMWVCGWQHHFDTSHQFGDCDIDPQIVSKKDTHWNPAFLRFFFVQWRINLIQP